MQNLTSSSKFSRGGFGRRLSAVRNSLGLNAPTFADRLGFPRRTYLTWEREESDPPARLLLLLARDYDIDLIWLLEGPQDVVQYGSARWDWDRYIALKRSLKDLAIRLGLNPSEDQIIDVMREISTGPRHQDEDALRHVERLWKAALGAPTNG
ncbi:helix-turn-helix domain-containing protein [Brevundimonas sp. SL130]|uniref:helix-turn-helix domain-containing protein n=1 Tax=Brevundimonas sp. SL130 TaxID=2995143 RepID=UPI00226CD61C|nr:helix-turn-helix domain-containing protein [Brevundimonas sp. SL130]WAC59790.1 helix-turn-helix domain-containing protein [Brevundimonas sp. SL130]